MIAPIEMATGQTAYFVGKPNPLMMRTGLRILGVHSEDAVMIGDRMDTDMVAGIETGLYTTLVLSGVTDRADIKKFPYRPQLVLNGVGDIRPRQSNPTKTQNPNTEKSLRHAACRRVFAYSGDFSPGLFC